MSETLHLIKDYEEAQKKIREIIKTYNKIAWEHFKNRGWRLTHDLDQVISYVDPYESEVYSVLYSYETDDFEENGVKKKTNNGPTMKDKITMNEDGDII